jgi:hypothetical protein
MVEKLGKQSVFWFVVLSFITLGFYMVHWFYKNKDAFNKLKSKVKIEAWHLHALLVAFVLYWVFVALNGFQLSYGAGGLYNTLGQLFDLITGVILIVYVFRIRLMMTDNFKGLNMHWFWTLIFNVFYVQYKINQLVDSKKIK